MNHDSFLNRRRRRGNAIVAIFLCAAAVIWVTTVLDQAFGLGWGLDRKGLWQLPLMAIGAVIVRALGLATLNMVSKVSGRGL